MIYDSFAEVRETQDYRLKELVATQEAIDSVKKSMKKLKLEKPRPDHAINEAEKTLRTLQEKKETLCEETYQSFPEFHSRWKAALPFVLESDGALSRALRDKYVNLFSAAPGYTIPVDSGFLKGSDFFGACSGPDLRLLDPLPAFSFAVRFQFKLATPYISRDDDAFYINENPIRKDKVFKVPTISGGAWKGNLRWVAGKRIEGMPAERERTKAREWLINLFGHENVAQRRYFDVLLRNEAEDINLETESIGRNVAERKSRLNFYPTFFDQMGLEVINPHDRKSKAGLQPIFIETVPKDASGTFTLLYVPFDLMGLSREKARQIITSDMDLVLNALKELFLKYGFSAKRSSGFGIAQEKLQKEDGAPSGLSSVKTETVSSVPFGDFDEMIRETKALLEGGD